MLESTILFLITLLSLTSKSLAVDNNWWRSMIVYQVYPRSFKDSNGDGIGDLNGITSKLEHLVDAGVRSVWLSPIYSSPQKDFGYDISNFTDIDPTYGDLEDFRELARKAKSLGLKLLLDFVPNHSSDEHDWFQKSVQKISPYDKYYIWKDAKMVNGQRTPPNNWISRFGGSAWEWNEQRKQYYLHQFLSSQPDLDYRDANLRKEMKNVLLFWLDLGVSGFRVDSVDFMVEDNRFLDEPRSGALVPNNTYEYLEHIYTKDQNETYEVVREWRQLLDDFSATRHGDKNIILTEAYTSLHHVMKYYEAGSNVPFNFMFIIQMSNTSTATNVKSILQSWLNSMPDGFPANWVTGNHDNHRVASRFGVKREDQMTALAIALPGITVIYNGDEIGMTDRWFSYEETVDNAGCAAGPDRYEKLSRDPERTPYQWDSTKHSGFSTGNQTWLPVNENYVNLNLEAQRSASVSHYKVFQAMSALKKLPQLTEGSVEIRLVTENVLAVVRRLREFTPIVLLINFLNVTITIDANGWLNIPESMRVKVASVKSNIAQGMKVDTKKLVLEGAATVFLGY